jgi:hypothetical protein
MRSNIAPTSAVEVALPWSVAAPLGPGGGFVATIRPSFSDRVDRSGSGC